MRIGSHRAHFSGYQPTVRAAQEFCEDIPHVAQSIIVLDLVDTALRDMMMEFRVVKDVRRIGPGATYADLGSAADIAAATYFHQGQARYPQGTLNVTLDFSEAGHFIGVLTASEPGTGRQLVAVFDCGVDLVRPVENHTPLRNIDNRRHFEK